MPAYPQVAAGRAATRPWRVCHTHWRLKSGRSEGSLRGLRHECGRAAAAAAAATLATAIWGVRERVTFCVSCNCCCSCCCCCCCRREPRACVDAGALCSIARSIARRTTAVGIRSGSSASAPPPLPLLTRDRASSILRGTVTDLPTSNARASWSELYCVGRDAHGRMGDATEGRALRRSATVRGHGHGLDYGYGCGHGCGCGCDPLARRALDRTLGCCCRLARGRGHGGSAVAAVWTVVRLHVEAVAVSAAAAVTFAEAAVAAAVAVVASTRCTLCQHRCCRRWQRGDAPQLPRPRAGSPHSHLRAFTCIALALELEPGCALPSVFALAPSLLVAACT